MSIRPNKLTALWNSCANALGQKNSYFKENIISWYPCAVRLMIKAYSNSGFIAFLTVLVQRLSSVSIHWLTKATASYQAKSSQAQRPCILCLPWPQYHLVECPSNFGDLLTDFNCYVSIVRWLIARPLPPSRERSVQDYPSYPRK